jgi:hypothetical protein
LYLPALQERHELAPELYWYFPDGQFRQELDAVEPLLGL